MRQSIIHVEQDDIDFDEEELEGERAGDKRPRQVDTDAEESQDVEMTVDQTTEEALNESSAVEGAAGPSTGGNTSSSQAGAAFVPPPAQPKRRMIITHDKFVSLQSLIILHLTSVERETGRGMDRDELIDWYLEFKEAEIQDVEALEYERELITKMLKKLVKVRQHHPLFPTILIRSSQDNYLIEARGDVQDSLPESMEESAGQSFEDSNVRVYYMVHPSVDTDTASSAM